MKCISRSTLGVLIGTLNLLFYIATTLFFIVNLVALNILIKDGSIKGVSSKKDYGPYNPWNKDEEYILKPSEKDAAMVIGNTLLIFILIVCLIMVGISVLLIMGIVKRRHSLMAPWLILSAIGCVFCCINISFDLFEGLSSGIPFGRVFMKFILNCLVIGVEALILYPIYTLYKDIRDKNNERPGQIISATEIGFTNAYTGQINEYIPVLPKV